MTWLFCTSNPAIREKGFLGGNTIAVSNFELNQHHGVDWLTHTHSLVESCQRILGILCIGARVFLLSFLFCFVDTCMYLCCCYMSVSSFVIMFQGHVSVSNVVLNAWFHLVTPLPLECNLDYLVVVQIIFCNGSDLWIAFSFISVLFLFIEEFNFCLIKVLFVGFAFSFYMALVCSLPVWDSSSMHHNQFVSQFIVLSK